MTLKVISKSTNPIEDKILTSSIFYPTIEERLSRLDDIKPNFSVNRDLDADKVSAIKKEIQETGEIKPLFMDKGGLVDGHHRYAALKELEAEMVPVFYFDGDLKNVPEFVRRALAEDYGINPESLKVIEDRDFEKSQKRHQRTSKTGKVFYAGKGSKVEDNVAMLKNQIGDIFELVEPVGDLWKSKGNVIFIKQNREGAGLIDWLRQRPFIKTADEAGNNIIRVELNNKTKKPSKSNDEDLKKKLEQLEEEHNKLIKERASSDELGDIVKKKNEVAKKLYPVIISIEEKRDLYGKPVGIYGDIDFWKANTGWYDDTIFHDTSRGFADPNELGKKIGVYFSEGGGSSHIRFIPTVKNIKEAESALKDAGYKVEIKKDIDKSLYDNIKQGKVTKEDKEKMKQMGERVSTQKEVKDQWPRRYSSGKIGQVNKRK